MMDEKTLTHMFDNEVITYYVEGDCIYAVYGTEVSVLPNNEHNIALCENHIYSKLKVFEENIRDLNGLLRSYSVRDKYTYLLERIMNRENIRFWYNVTFLYHHIHDSYLLPCNIVEDALEIGGEIRHVESPLATSNIFSLEPMEINHLAKNLKKELAKTNRSAK